MIKKNMIDLGKLFQVAETAEVAQVATTGSGKYSVSVVNSNGNGKRITLSKALVEKLELDGYVSMMPLQSEGVLMLAKTLPFDNASTIELNSSDRRIAYHAGAVKLIVDTFSLDYSGGRTSMSFNDIEFGERDEVVIAIVKIPTAAMATSGAGEAL